MATVAPNAPNHKPLVYYAHLDDEAGTLAKLDGTIYFMAEATGALTVIEPEHVPFLAVLGNVGLADTQQVMDSIRGGAAKLACTR